MHDYRYSLNKNYILMKTISQTGKPVSPFLMRLAVMIFVILVHCPEAAQAQLKIYINTDLEGISGVYKFDQTRIKDSPLNIQACEYFMDDLTAVIRGLKEAGVTEIIVLDGHGTQCIIPHMMVTGAKYITGLPRPGAGNLTGLDSSFSGMIMLGFHAMMGTPDGVLNHTQSSKTENRYWYNGVESGEIAQGAAIAGYYGVPVIMATGDEALCREVRKFLGENCVTVATKRGISREAAELYPFEETHKALYEGAKKAVAALPACKPYILSAPIRVKEEYLNLDPNLPKPEVIKREGVAGNALQIFTWWRK